ncbi:MAG: ABC transporter permease [Candidatus Nomurabacteria bacterium]|jgi:cell division transport system permease protein|nr:ABC transporter permease [Candidatus Nomurabacteria bacterium]
MKPKHVRQTLKALRKHRKRPLLNVGRKIKYGVKGFVRNAWLSVAATAIMIVTLLIISATMIARNVLLDTVKSIENNVDMSIFLKQDTSDAQIQKLYEKFWALGSVRTVEYVSPNQAEEEYRFMNSDDPDALAALDEATNMFPWIFHVKVNNLSDISELESFVNSDEDMQALIDPKRAPSFADERRVAIDNIASTARFVEKVGLIAGSVFVVIAFLIIFNTIRMAIFNRHEEIYMMKLIGADKGFIRGPFIVEAIIYGILAAVFAGLILVGLLSMLREHLVNYGVEIQSTYDLAKNYWGVFFLALLIIGIFIGMISSYLATRKYLKLSAK